MTGVGLLRMTLVGLACLVVGCGGVSPASPPKDSGVDVPTINANDSTDGVQDRADGDLAVSPDLAGEAEAAVEVAPELPPAPVILSFTATPSLLPASGGMVKLEWEARDAVDLEIGGVGPVSGTSAIVNVTGSQVFTLTAANAGGADAKTLVVEVDEVLPKIVSSTPENNATGVAGDASIVIRFNKAMNRGKTQAAYTLTDIPSDLTSMSWDSSGAMLTIKPTISLMYAIGTTLDTPAKKYTLTLLESAEDLAGNKLARTVIVFQTLRKLTVTLPRLTALDGWTDNGVVALATDGSNIWVGDTEANLPVRGLLSYDITGLPTNLVSIDRAEAFAYQTALVGSPYAGLGGTINTEHVVFSELTPAVFNSASLGTIGSFDGDAAATGWRRADVTAALRDDVAHRSQRGQRSQYRLSFPTSSNGNSAVDRVEFYDRQSAIEPYLSAALTTP